MMTFSPGDVLVVNPDTTSERRARTNNLDFNDEYIYRGPVVVFNNNFHGDGDQDLLQVYHSDGSARAPYWWRFKHKVELYIQYDPNQQPDLDEDI